MTPHASSAAVLALALAGPSLALAQVAAAPAPAATTSSAASATTTGTTTTVTTTTAAPVAAAPAPLPAGATLFRGLVGGALTAGGEKIATLQFTNGDTTDVTTGGLIDLWGGVEVRPAGGPVSLQATVGYHVDGVFARNGEVSFTRVPVELIGLVDVAPRVRIGAGLRYATNVELSSSGAAAGAGAQKFDNAWGGIVQAEWLVTPRLGLLARYVNESYGYSYTYVNANNQITTGRAHVDGSHGGIGLNFYF